MKNSTRPLCRGAVIRAAALRVLMATALNCASIAHSALLVYEPFDYNGGTLTAENGGTGFASGWETTGAGADASQWGPNASATNASAPDWDGQVDNIPLSSAKGEYRFVGGQINNTAYNIDIYRTLSSSAGAMAGGDNVLWMSAVIHLENRGSGSGINIGLGDGGIRNRGLNWVGDSVDHWIGAAGYEKMDGGSTAWRANKLNAVVLTNAWNTDVTLGLGTFTQGATLTSSATTDDFVLVFKFTFGFGAANDTCEAYAFDETVALSEATFNANAVSAVFAGFDQGACTVLSYSANSRNNLVDEIRIGDSFDDVIAASDAGDTDVGKSSTEASPDAVGADGVTSSTITVTLLDGFGTPLSGKTVTLGGSTGNATITPVTPTTDANGEATFTVVSSTVEAEVFTATNSTDAAALLRTATIFFLGPTDAAESTVTGTRDVVVADGNDASTITIVLKDAAGNPVAGNNVTLGGSTGNAIITPGGAQVSDANGQVTFAVKSSTAETEVFTAEDTDDSVTITETFSVSFGAADAADLLVYEPFDYAEGALAGQNGGTGFSAAWSAPRANEEPAVWGASPNVMVGAQDLDWDGAITNIRTSTTQGEARYMATETDNGEGKTTISRTLAASAGAMAGDDGILWMSTVCHFEDRMTDSGLNLGLGNGYVYGRGLSFSGDMFIGSVCRNAGLWTGTRLNAVVATNAWWLSSPSFPDYYSYADGAAFSSDDYVLVFKFTFSGYQDTVETYAFPEASALSEATFDANKVSATFPGGFDEDECTTLSYTHCDGGNAIDEIRIGNTFSDICPAPVNAVYGTIFLFH